MRRHELLGSAGLWMLTGLACRESEPPTAPRIAGVVRHADGTPAVGVTVLVESADGWELRRIESDVQGRFLADDLRGGSFRVTAIARRDSAACELVTVRSVASGDPDLDLHLRVSGSLEIAFLGAPDPSDVIASALDEEGFPAGSARNALDAAVRSTVTEEPTPEGLRIRGLEPGAYWLVARDDEHSLAALGRVEVQDGKTARVELELVPATRLEVTAPCAVEPCIAELALRTLTGFLDRGSFADCLLTEGSYAESVLLPPGTYHLELTTFEEGRAEADVTLAGEPELELSFALDPGR